MSSSSPSPSLATRLRIPAIFAVAAASILFALHRVQFDWTAFARELRTLRWLHILVGTALIYSTYWLRAWRWSALSRPSADLAPTHPQICPLNRSEGQRKDHLLPSPIPQTPIPHASADRTGPPRTLGPRAFLGIQFVGFTAVALFGRLADLARPYLASRRTGLPLPSQIAVYTVERIFDLGAAALVFSSALAFTPAGLAHRDRFVRVGLGSLAATLLLATFAIALRLRGDRIAALAHRRLPARIAPAVHARILGFRSGLQAISTPGEFLLAAAISVTMWLLIGGAYWQTTHAFVLTPELSTLSFSRTMLLMAASLGGSLLQLPGLGWFTQIAATAAAMHAFYNAPLEASTACGAMLLLVTSLSIIPAGLLFARLEGISLRRVTETSESNRLP